MMNEEQAPEVTQEAESAAPSAEQQTEEKPGSKFVEINDPEVKARFDKVYGQLKFQQRVNEELVGTTRALKEKLEQFEAKTTQKETADNKAVIKAALAKAHEDGNYRAVAELTERLVTLEAPKAKEPERPVHQPQNEMSQQELAQFNNWLTELDETGNIKRPWALAHHPQYESAVEITNRILADPSISMNGMQAVLSALDKEMGSRRSKPATAPVLDGAGGKPRQAKALTPEQQYVARKMGLTDKQYLENL
jgi:hypothetical protein